MIKKFNLKDANRITLEVNAEEHTILLEALIALYTSEEQAVDCWRANQEDIKKKWFSYHSDKLRKVKRLIEDI